MSAFDSFELQDAKARIAELEAALANIAEDESINRGEMVAIASHALCSAAETFDEPSRTAPGSGKTGL